MYRFEKQSLMDLNMNALSRSKNPKIQKKEARNAGFQNCCPQDLYESCMQALVYCVCCTHAGQCLFCGLPSLKCYTGLSFI